MEKYLYFAQGDGANATSEAVMYSASAFRGADVASGKVVLYFKPAAIGDAVATGDVNDKIELTITDGDQKAVLKAIAEAMVGSNTKSPFTVIADEDNGIFVHSSITVCETTLAA
tara:strand:+ start:2514 stop:2855 length:342 start_codon:yes stop_codon:yes gene_type:complete